MSRNWKTRFCSRSFGISTKLAIIFSNTGTTVMLVRYAVPEYMQPSREVSFGLHRQLSTVSYTQQYCTNHVPQLQMIALITYCTLKHVPSIENWSEDVTAMTQVNFNSAQNSKYATIPWSNKIYPFSSSWEDAINTLCVSTDHNKNCDRN